MLRQMSRKTNQFLHQVNLPPELPPEVDYILFNRNPAQYIWFPDIFVDKTREIRSAEYKIPPVYLRMYNTSR